MSTSSLDINRVDRYFLIGGEWSTLPVGRWEMTDERGRVIFSGEVPFTSYYDDPITPTSITISPSLMV